MWESNLRFDLQMLVAFVDSYYVFPFNLTFSLLANLSISDGDKDSVEASFCVVLTFDSMLVVGYGSALDSV